MFDDREKDPSGLRQDDEPGFEEGFDQERDTPEEEQVGRFSTGHEQGPERSAEKDDVGRFSTGIERDPDHAAEKDHEGDFAEGGKRASTNRDAR